eukprot:5245239-Ditylum_brightwellii.AAC.1
MSASNKTFNLALECVPFAAVITNLWKIHRCGDIVHPHLLTELLIAKNCVVSSVRHYQQPLIEGLLGPLYTVTPVSSGLKGAKTQGGILK